MVKVLQGFGITKQKEARRKLRIKRGDVLELEIEGAKIVLTSPEVPENPTLKMLGLAARQGPPRKKVRYQNQGSSRKRLSMRVCQRRLRR